MLRDEVNEVAPTWAQEDPNDAHDYRAIDRRLRSLAKQKARLEVEEAKWLREADRLRVWRKLGYSTALEYLEEVFGYAPRTAMDRLRVAKELGELPELEAEVRNGALPWSAAKELTRVMTPHNVAAWLQRARGKNVHDIQALVAGHKKGDDPDAPKDPALMTRPWLLKLTPRVDALLEQLRSQFEGERGEHLEDEELLEAICVRALEPAPPTNGKAPKPTNRLVTHTCDGCLRGWRQGRGKLVELPASDVELAGCDAEIVAGVRAAAIDADQDGEPASDGVRKKRSKRRPRPTLTIPKATRDLVWQRDQGRCRVPGCRATRNLACHHIRFRSQGGDHDPANLVLLCDGHHKLLHDGLLTITGRAPDELTFTRNGQRLVDSRSATELGAADELRAQANVSAANGCSARGMRASNEGNKRSRFGDVVKLEHAKQALMQLGFKARAARAALEEACAHVGADADIPTLVKAALDLSRRSDPRENSSTDVSAEAKRALVQLGYPSAVAAAAVQAACAHVGTNIELPLLLKEALRRCGGS